MHVLLAALQLSAKNKIGAIQQARRALAHPLCGAACVSGRGTALLLVYTVAVGIHA